jgi:hypothetical protein
VRRLALPLVALAVALAGCGGDGEPGVSDPGAATTDVERTGTIPGGTTTSGEDDDDGDGGGDDDDDRDEPDDDY